MIDCYIINLERSFDRWEDIKQAFESQRLNLIRVAGVDGSQIALPHPDFSPWRYFFFHGRIPKPGQIGCYFSHLKALRLFLESGKEYAVICEDDVLPKPELSDVLDKVVKYADLWDLVRLNGSRQKAFLSFADLGNGYQLISDLRCSSSTGSYMISRRGAQIILKKLVPMWTNIDVALFWSRPVGIREVTVNPFPIPFAAQNDRSTIGYASKNRYPLFHPAILRFFVLLPYRFFSRCWRQIHRLRVGITRRLFPPRIHE